MTKFLRLPLFLILFSFIFLSPIKAQEATSSDLENAQEAGASGDPQLKTELIWQRERLDDEIAALKIEYTAHLENYRNQDKLYRIAFDQHQELQTLVSLEDLLNKSKVLAIARDEVLIDYLTLLKLSLISSEGVELSLKNEKLGVLDYYLDFLAAHLSEMDARSSRDEIAEGLSIFTNVAGEIDEDCQEVLVLLSLSNLQRIYDKAFVLKNNIDDYLIEQERLSEPEIERASEETERSLENANQSLTELWSEIIERNSLSTLYKDLVRELNPIYVSLSQSLSYLSELLSL